jgi:hypothetical protein
MLSGSARRSGTGARFESNERGGGAPGGSVGVLAVAGAPEELFGMTTNGAPPSELSAG